MPLTTTLAGIIRPALRAAGITKRPGIGPSPDQYNELIPEVNQLLQSWNCNGQMIFATKIEEFELVSGQKIYTIGPGGDFDTVRPQFIKDVNLIFPTNPQLRTPIKILDEHEWSLISIQDIGNALPWGIFYNPTYGSTGRGTIYLAFQPPEGYSIELYTWSLLGAAFVSINDLVILPDGYEDAIKWNLALRVASLYPWEAKISPEVTRLASQSLNRLKVLNTTCPTLRSEAEFIGRGDGWYWSGMFAAGGSGSSQGMTPLTVTGTIDGTNGWNGNALFTLSDTPSFLQLFKNGLLLTEDVSYSLSGSGITFLAPNIPVVTDTLLAWGIV